MGGGTNPTLGQDPTLSFCTGPCKSCSWPVQRPRHMGEILSEGKDELHSSITEKEAQPFLRLLQVLKTIYSTQWDAAFIHFLGDITTMPCKQRVIHALESVWH